MKYIVFKNNKVLRILDKEPTSVTKGVEVARCDFIPTLNIGEYYEVFNIQEHIETYTEKEPREVKKIDELGNEYTETEYVEVAKQRPYKTCSLAVFDKPNKAQLIAQKQSKDYENKIVALIRKKYSLNAELGILRQRDSKPQEYAEYNAYVEQCKAIVKGSV